MLKLIQKVTKESNRLHLTRRKFLAITYILSIFLLLNPSNYSYSLSKRKKIPLTARNLLRGKFKFFTPYQATVVEEVTSLIIPSDDDPGAREAGIVFEIDKIINNSNIHKEIYTKGIEWLDYMAEKISDKESFIDLSDKEKIKVLRMADSAKLSHIHKGYLFIRYRVTRAARKFFYTVKRQTIEVFYTGETGWKVVGYEGPPQWSGHFDYYKCS